MRVIYPYPTIFQFAYFVQWIYCSLGDKQPCSIGCKGCSESVRNRAWILSCQGSAIKNCYCTSQPNIPTHGMQPSGINMLKFMTQGSCLYLVWSLKSLPFLWSAVWWWTMKCVQGLFTAQTLTRRFATYTHATTRYSFCHCSILIYALTAGHSGISEIIIWDYLWRGWSFFTSNIISLVYSLSC